MSKYMACGGAGVPAGRRPSGSVDAQGGERCRDELLTEQLLLDRRPEAGMGDREPDRPFVVLRRTERVSCDDRFDRQHVREEGGRAFQQSEGGPGEGGRVVRGIVGRAGGDDRGREHAELADEVTAAD
jgi:hypothetical protein